MPDGLRGRLRDQTVEHPVNVIDDPVKAGEVLQWDRFVRRLHIVASSKYVSDSDRYIADDPLWGRFWNREMLLCVFYKDI